jgi:hypothetical protein
MNTIIMDILLYIRLNLSTEGMLCCELSRIRHTFLRRDNSNKPVGKLGEILELNNMVNQS